MRDINYANDSLNRSVMDHEKSTDYVEGFLEAMRVFKHPIPVTGSHEQIVNWVLETATAYELEVYTQRLARARKILSNCKFDKNAFRAMVFGCKTFEEYARLLGNDNVIDDLKDRERQLYSYDDSGARWVDFEMEVGPVWYYRVSTDDVGAMQACFELEFTIGDTITLMYLQEACDGGKLLNYQDIIRKAVKSVPMRTHKSMSAPMLQTKAKVINHE